MAIGRLQQPLPRRSPRRIDWAHHRQPQDNDGDQCEHDAQHPLLARAACPPLHLQTFRHDRTVMSARRSEEPTSDLQSPMTISYAIFCVKKKHKNTTTYTSTT